jgi:hypothetical protein
MSKKSVTKRTKRSGGNRGRAHTRQPLGIVSANKTKEATNNFLPPKYIASSNADVDNDKYGEDEESSMSSASTGSSMSSIASTSYRRINHTLNLTKKGGFLVKFGTKASNNKKGLSVSNEFDDIPRDAFAVTTSVESPSMNQDDLILVNIIDQEGDYCSQPFIDLEDSVDAEQPNVPTVYPVPNYSEGVTSIDSSSESTLVKMSFLEIGEHCLESKIQDVDNVDLESGTHYKVMDDVVSPILIQRLPDPLTTGRLMAVVSTAFGITVFVICMHIILGM